MRWPATQPSLDQTLTQSKMLVVTLAKSHMYDTACSWFVMWFQLLHSHVQFISCFVCSLGCDNQGRTSVSWTRVARSGTLKDCCSALWNRHPVWIRVFCDAHVSELAVANFQLTCGDTVVPFSMSHTETICPDLTVRLSCIDYFSKTKCKLTLWCFLETESLPSNVWSCMVTDPCHHSLLGSALCWKNCDWHVNLVFFQLVTSGTHPECESTAVESCA